MVSHNGQRVCLAGIESTGVATLYANIHLLTQADLEDLWLSVAGQDNATNERLKWAHLPLAAGDEITIRIIETPHWDSPNQRRPFTPEETAE